MAVPISRRTWRLLVPVTTGLAGLLIATSAITARGTDLRSGPARLVDVISAAQHTVAGRTAVEHRLRSAVSARTRAVATAEAPVAAARRVLAELAGPAGLTPVRGPGLSVSLSDAPHQKAGTQLPGNPTPNDLVIHQQDVQAVVNALWAGGAEAMTLMGKRVISTTAVRCVGNTLLLEGAVYSPPFVITAIGSRTRMRAALDADPDVSIFRQYVAAFGLGYQVREFTDATLPGYTGPLDLTGVRAG